MLSKIASLSAGDIFLGLGPKVSVSGATRKLDHFTMKTVEECLALQKRPIFLFETIDKMVEEIQTTWRDTAKLLSKLERSLEIVSASQKQVLYLQEKLLVLGQRPVAHIPHLPTEVACHIFMMSAEDGQQQRMMLSLVSTQGQQWLAPFFFRRIVTPRYSPTVQPFPLRILPWAKSLTVTTDIAAGNSDASSMALNRFSCLDTIKFHKVTTFSAWNFSISTLQHMFIIWDSLVWKSLNPLPLNLMVSLTHIHVTFIDQVADFPWHDLIYAENLVFLVIDSVETKFSRNAGGLRAILNAMQSRIFEFSVAPSLEVILWVNLPITFPTAEWHSCSNVPIDDRLILGMISVAPEAECDFGKFCVLGVENEYQRFDIWSLEVQGQVFAKGEVNE